MTTSEERRIKRKQAIEKRKQLAEIKEKRQAQEHSDIQQEGKEASSKSEA